MLKNKIVIIEDEFFAANHLSDLVTSLGFLVAGVYHSGEYFLQNTDWDFEVAIVDIFLSSQMTGLQVAERLKEKSKHFIFLTANQDSQTLKSAARLSPQAYISKPFKDNDVSAALEIISHQNSPKISVRGAHGAEWLSIDNILFIKASGAYIEINTQQGMILQRMLLREIWDILPKDQFIRVHRSYLVNKDHIKFKTSGELKVEDHKIPISKSYRKNLPEL